MMETLHVLAVPIVGLGVAALIGYATAKRLLRRVVRSAVWEVLKSQDHNIEYGRQRRALVETVDFIEQNMPLARPFPDRTAIRRHAIDIAARAPFDGLYCEFGVYQGQSIAQIAALVPKTIHGFDSFEGIPDDWRSNFKKGAFAVNEPPTVPPNVILHKGWFHETLPKFLREYPGPVSFLHIDCDLYSSTKVIFDQLRDRIVPGTVILFDEFFNYPGWRDGEYKAFAEFVAARGIEFEYLGYSQDDEQVAVRIRDAATGQEA